MFKLFLSFFIVLLPFVSVIAQISTGGEPESFQLKSKSAIVLPVLTLTPFDSDTLLLQDRDLGIPNRYGVVQSVSVDIKKGGIITEIVGKGFIWQYQMASINACSIGITFGEFHLPEGAKLFIYDDTHTSIMGAFTSQNNNSNNQLTIADLKSSNAIVEYFEPYQPPFSGQLTITSIAQGYRSLLKDATVRVGVNCPEGSDWQDAKHAVCRMTYHDTRYSYYCTGFLVNNVREDGVPYFQTANHCISTSSEASTLVTYFNYENSGCNTTDASATQTLSGATLKATNSYTDFTLLLLNEYPPVSYLPFYAGWDASSRQPLEGSCIHHPEGTAKCIALDYQAPATNSSAIKWSSDTGATSSSSASNTHWKVQFSVGTTESGSSGSPLFDDNKKVIGQLHGGSDSDNYYGKFSLSWNYSADVSSQLKAWLDPDNTGLLSLDGIYSTIKPEADFSTSLVNICPGSAIQFTDQSKYHPTAWYWTVKPSSYSFTNGTNMNSQNPAIIFESENDYTITLEVSNNNGVDELSRSDYIHAGKLNVKFSGITADSMICGCDLVDFPLVASGAANYTFAIERPDKMTFSEKSDTLYLSQISSERKNGSYTSWLKVTGTQGACSTSDSIDLKVSMPVNDDVANAIRLSPGRNSSYSNFCASEESGEAGSATSSTTKKSIWFKFQAPSRGIITIDTHGFNDHIAVYDAASYANLTSANTSLYNLLASNDNRSLSDNSALISDLEVEPYKIYWLQVDGTNGATGSCVIDLLSNSLELYPNPSTGDIHLIVSNMDDGVAEVQIVSLLGQVIYANTFPISKESNRINFILSAYSAGIYTVIVRINGSVMKRKLLLR